MRYAHYDNATGEILGFYDDRLHKDIPQPAAIINDADWQAHISGDFRMVDVTTGKIIPKPKPAPTWADIRAERDARLKASDWAALPDSNPPGGRAAWLAYRQALRDLPANQTDPAAIVWPTPPA